MTNIFTKCGYTLCIDVFNSSFLQNLSRLLWKTVSHSTNYQT